MSTRRATRQPPTHETPAPSASGARVRVRVRAGGPERRYRAGLGPFGPSWAELADVPAQVVEALRADPLLMVEVMA